MIHNRNKWNELSHLDGDFFEIDETAGVARIKLRFGNPTEIFDKNYVSKLPVLSDDFMDWIESVFSLVSSKYKIDLTVEFDDLGGYGEDALEEIFQKNIELEFKSKFAENRQKNRIAFSLIGIGLLFFLGMLFVEHVWGGDSVWREIFAYVSDIATTVTFWEAMTILVVEQRERRAYLKNLLGRFSAIRFQKA